MYITYVYIILIINNSVIGITEFVSAETLRQIVERMVPETETDKTVTEKKFKELYSSEILHENHKSDVYR